ncbi:MAG TPA: hemerythrin domain-containing protein [Gaiellaceae bacterium]|jgi:iron-sulfur cluster repair protein YtfE (RIC family)
MPRAASEENLKTMAQQLTEPLRRRHESLWPKVGRIAEVARELPSLEPAERKAVVAELAGFLRGELRLHAEAEEAWLYPEIALQLRHPFSLAGMAFDHRLLEEQVEALEAAELDDVPAVQELLFRIYTTLEIHFRKEEEVYLPMLEYEYESSSVASIAQSMARYELGEPVHDVRPDIDLEARDFPRRGLPAEKLAYLLQYAVLAPSSHNSQPWRFRLRDDAVELLADRSRALPVVDPDDRELTMSCGAALLTLRAAIRQHGLMPEVELLPDGSDPDLLARVRLGERRPPARADRLLFWAISARQTNRNAFEPRPVPEELLAELRLAVEEEGAQVKIFEHDEDRRRLADLVAEADKRQFADGSFRRELAAWMHRSRRRSRDGMPIESLHIPKPIDPIAPFVVRTFDVGRGVAAHDRKIADGSPVLAVLGTPGDEPRDWLIAGQALARLLLRAAQDGVSASFLNQPIEVAELRAPVSELARIGVPQIVLRMGYGPPVKPTPRRPLSDVVQLDEE